MQQCINCHGGCCRAVHCELTGFDILRITKTLGISPFFFTVATPVEGEKLEKSLGETPLFIFTDSGEEKYYKLALQAEISELFGYTNKCIFLMEWDAQELGSKKIKGIAGRCGIYHCRPLTCRTFPTKLNENKEPCVIDPHSYIKTLEGNFWKKDAYQFCPEVVKPSDLQAFSDEYFKDLYVHEAEIQFFLKISKKWNKNPDISDNFIAFLEKEYENRLLFPEKI